MVFEESTQINFQLVNEQGILYHIPVATMSKAKYGRLKDSSEGGDDVMKAGATFIKRTSTVDAPTELFLDENEKSVSDKIEEANTESKSDCSDNKNHSPKDRVTDKYDGDDSSVEVKTNVLKRKTSRTLHTRRNAIWEESSSEREGLKKLLDYYVLLQNLQDFNMGTFTFPYCLE